MTSEEGAYPAGMKTWAQIPSTHLKAGHDSMSLEPQQWGEQSIGEWILGAHSPLSIAETAKSQA